MVKHLRFHYLLELRFSELVKEHHFTLRAFPKSDDCQSVTGLRIEVSPNQFLEETEDAFGNTVLYGYEPHEHDLFHCEVSGFAETGLARFRVAGPSYTQGMFLRQTPLTEPGPELRAFFETIALPEGAPNLEKATILMNALCPVMTYQSGSTSVETTAEDAFAQKKGVCQDYSHIFLSLCRMAGIPCKYVAGMLLGTGESHAWVEIYDKEAYYALDPTNQIPVTDSHIKIACAADGTGCSMNLGIMRGYASQQQLIQVIVQELSM